MNYAKYTLCTPFIFVMTEYQLNVESDGGQVRHFPGSVETLGALPLLIAVRERSSARDLILRDRMELSNAVETRHNS